MAMEYLCTEAGLTVPTAVQVMLKTSLHIEGKADFGRPVWTVSTPGEMIPTGWHPVSRMRGLKRVGRTLYWLLPWVAVAGAWWLA